MLGLMAKVVVDGKNLAVVVINNLMMAKVAHTRVTLPIMKNVTGMVMLHIAA